MSDWKQQLNNNEKATSVAFFLCWRAWNTNKDSNTQIQICGFPMFPVQFQLASPFFASISWAYSTRAREGGPGHSFFYNLNHRRPTEISHTCCDLNETELILLFFSLEGTNSEKNESINQLWWNSKQSVKINFQIHAFILWGCLVVLWSQCKTLKLSEPCDKYSVVLRWINAVSKEICTMHHVL